MIDQFHTVLLVGWTLTIIVFGVLLRKYTLKCRYMRRRIRYVSSTCDCIVNLLDEAAHSLKENTGVDNFVETFTEYSARSLRSQSAAFFHYNKNKRTVKAVAVSGPFPTLFNASSKLITLLSSSPDKLKEYLLNKEFPLAITPFGEAITEQHVVVFNKKELKERLRSTTVQCNSMMIIPVTTDAVFGVLIVANKMKNSDFKKDDIHLAVGMSETAGITISQLLSLREIQEKRKIDQQLKTASVIQKHLLPQTVPLTDKFDIATFYKPAQQIGGDYFDFIDVDDDHLGIVIADVSGKGYAAGLVMATARSLFSVMSRANLSPSDVLCELNKYLVKLIPQEMFISVIYAIFNKKSREIVWARAGHEPLICCSVGKKPKILDGGNGMVVGMLEGEAFRQTLTDENYTLNPGDVVLFYTDGVTEANDPEENEFGMNRLINTMRSVTKMSAENAINLIVHKLSRFVHDHPPYDDMSLVLIRAIPENDTNNSN
ncbi:MAG: hypothetical protein DRI44_01360 [Chlamydiae bacterium]|nr:MAG: hypothetical protein DRI44_01360 [Chlamydiota bacterium]